MLGKGMEHAEFTGRYLTGEGVEIGAFTTPIPGIRPTYVDRFATYAGQTTLADYFGDACDLPYYDDSLDFVASSHLLEHVANPLAALREWMRVLRHGGYVYMVIPDRRYTFDRPRQLTETAHMLADFRSGVTQCDGTHIDDFVFGVDWSLFSPSTLEDDIASARAALANAYRRSVEAGLEINIHFHTFERERVVELLSIGNREAVWEGTMEIIEIVEQFPGSNPIGFLVVARAKKRLGHRLSSTFAKKGLRFDARRIREAQPRATANSSEGATRSF